MKTCPKCGNNTLKKTTQRAQSGNFRWACRFGSGTGYCYRTTQPDAPYRDQGGNAKKADRNPQFTRPLRGKRFVITWAQNATPVHEGFLASLKTFCEAYEAELIVIPGRYKNATSQWSESQENAEWWAEELVPYLYNQRRSLNSKLTLIGDFKIQPTRSSPLTGKEGITHMESGIFGHPKLALRCVPTPASDLPKLMATTGAVTVPNYTDSDAGKMGEFHHVMGAAIVEVQDNKLFHLRHVNYSESQQGFIDLEFAYFADGRVEDAPPYEAIIFGDAHWRFADKQVVDATFNKLVPLLKPKRLVWHDLLDGYACSPHHQGNPFIAAAKRAAGYDDMRNEVEQTIAWINEAGAGYDNWIVGSNHDDMLRRWVIREDWKRDPVNAEFYLETALAMLRTTRMTESGSQTLDPFQMFVERAGLPHVTCVPINGSLMIAGIECGLHGDKGPNGARGSLKNLRRIGPKVIIGHSHTPGIDEGGYQTGTMTKLEAEYTGPVGSWMNTHCAIDGFGKRHLLNCIDGMFWLE